MSINTTNDNSIYAILYSQNVDDQIREDEQKEIEMLAALISILKDALSTVSASQSGTPEIGAQRLANDSKKLSDAVKGKEGGHRNSQHPYQPHAPIAKSSPSLTTLYPSSQAMA